MSVDVLISSGELTNVTRIIIFQEEMGFKPVVKKTLVELPGL